MIRGGLELASSYHEFTPSEFYTKTIRTDLETLKITTTRHFFFDVIAIPSLIHADIQDKHSTEHSLASFLGLPTIQFLITCRNEGEDQVYFIT